MSIFGDSMGPADLAAVMGNSDGGFGNGNGWWIILLLLLGWGNGYGNGFGGGNNNMLPYFFNNSDAATQRGFDTAALTSQLSGIANAVNNGFASAEIANCGRAADALQTAYNNQIASMNQSFANAQAIDSRLDNIVLQQQNCCCENKQLIADLKYTIATEAAATRVNCDKNNQTILDKLCQLEIDGLKETNSNLRSQINEANRLASQSAQTAAILQSQAEQTQQIENYIRPQINPAYMVPNPYVSNYGWNYNGCCGQV